VEGTSGRAVWVGRVITGLVSLPFLFSAVMKLVGGADLKEGIAHLGLPESMVVPLAILEMACTVVYLIPATSVLGAILLAGYIGGAICTHWRVGDPFFLQVVVGALVWLGIYLREPRLKALVPLRRPRPATRPPLAAPNPKPEGASDMRFMVLVKADRNSEAGVLPSGELVAAMGKFNEEMVKAGVLLAGEGLHPSAKGARITFSGSKRTVTGGPFAETKELVAGFWLIQVKSKEEAIEWMSRAPFEGGEAIEIRQVFEASDFPPEILPPEAAARKRELREQVEKRSKR